MLKKALILMIACAGLLLTTVQPAAGECNGKINITLENFGSFAATVQVIDVNRNSQVFSGSLEPWAKTTLSICKSSAGYGHIKYKKKGQSGWTSSSLLKNGDTVKI